MLEQKLELTAAERRDKVCQSKEAELEERTDAKMRAPKRKNSKSVGTQVKAAQ